jgi:hypothetical protein
MPRDSRHQQATCCCWLRAISPCARNRRVPDGGTSPAARATHAKLRRICTTASNAVRRCSLSSLQDLALLGDRGLVFNARLRPPSQTSPAAETKRGSLQPLSAQFYWAASQLQSVGHRRPRAERRSRIEATRRKQPEDNRGSADVTHRSRCVIRWVHQQFMSNSHAQTPWLRRYRAPY